MVMVLVGEASDAVGLAGVSVGWGDTCVGNTSVGVAVAVAAIVGVANALAVGEGATYATVGGGVDDGSLAPVHPARMMTTRSQQRKASLWRLSIRRQPPGNGQPPNGWELSRRVP